jgi:hypothetical protein
MSEILCELRRRKTEISVISETNRKAKGTEETATTPTAGVGIILREEQKLEIYSRVSDGIVTVKT